MQYTNYTKNYTIADIGAGTGILTRQLAKKPFKEIYAVEPNVLMQNYSIKKDKSGKIHHLNTTSENTTLPTASIDIIFIGTAIHWMEPKKH